MVHIELYNIESEFYTAIKKHVEESRNTCTFDISIEFPKRGEVFYFKGSWNFQNDEETKIEVNFNHQDCGIQFPDFEVNFKITDLQKIEKYILNQNF